MARARGSDGKFYKIEDGENEAAKDFRIVFNYFYFLLKLSPLFIMLYTFWTILDLPTKLNSYLVIMACGKNLTCCPTTNSKGF